MHISIHQIQQEAIQSLPCEIYEVEKGEQEIR